MKKKTLLTALLMISVMHSSDASASTSRFFDNMDGKTIAGCAVVVAAALFGGWYLFCPKKKDSGGQSPLPQDHKNPLNKKEGGEQFLQQEKNGQNLLHQEYGHEGAVTPYQQQGPSANVRVSGVIPDGQGGVYATVEFLGGTPPSSPTKNSLIKNGMPSGSLDSTYSDDEFFDEGAWNEALLSSYKEIFDVLRVKNYDYSSRLVTMYEQKNTRALTNLMLAEVSDEHYLDLTRICHGMRDFVDITLPDSVIALSEGLVLEGFIDGQRVSVDGTNLNTNDIQRLQEITQINGKAFIQILTEFIERVTFKTII